LGFGVIALLPGSKGYIRNAYMPLLVAMAKNHLPNDPNRTNNFLLLLSSDHLGELLFHSQQTRSNCKFFHNTFFLQPSGSSPLAPNNRAVSIAVFLASIASFSLLITGYFSDVFDLRLLHRALFIGRNITIL
jgi:hypothetical protein